MAYSSRGSSRGNRRGGGGSDWKSSPILAVVAVVLIVFAMFRLYQNMGGDSARFVIQNFPYQWIAVNSVEDYQKGAADQFAPVVKRYNTDKRPSQIPFQEGGTWYWDAAQCQSRSCPFFVAQKDVPEDQRVGFIFPNVSERFFKERMQWAQEGYPGMDMESEGASEAEMARRAKFEEMMNMPAECPRCRKTRNPEFMAGEYYDEEGKAKLAELRERIMKETRR